MRLLSKSDMDMTSGPLVANIIRFAVPLFLAGILQSAFNMADSIVVGRFVGAAALAAIAASTPIYMLVINAFSNFSLGAAIAISHSLGAKNDRDASEFSHCAVLLSIIIGVFFAVTGLALSRSILNWISVPEEIMEDALVYFRITIAAAPIILLYNFSATILRTTGDTTRPFIFLLIAGALNVALNILFVAAFDMGVFGVALATAISNALSALLTLAALMRLNGPCKISIKKLRLYPKRIIVLVRYGLPIAIQSCLFAISNTFFQSAVNSFGTYAIAGSSVSVTLEGYLGEIIIAFANAALTFTGQNYGAKNAERIKKVCISTHLIGAAFAIFATVLVYAFRSRLVSLFVSDSPETVYYATLRLFYTSLLLTPGSLMQNVGSRFMRGLGKTVIPMIISVFFICIVRIIWLYTVFPMYNTLGALYVSYPITQGATGVVILIFEIIEYKKVKKRFAHELCN